MFFFSGIDMERTKAYAEENRSILWLNVKGRDPKGIVEPGKEYEALRDVIIEELEKLTCPYTGEKIVERAYRREELYSGDYVHEAADILVMWNGYTARLSHTSKGPDYIKKLSKSELEKLEANLQHNAEHWLNGIFLAWGPNVKPGTKIDNAHIMDLAPTALFAQGVPVPKDMDGKVLTDIFEPAYLKENSIVYEDVRGETGDEHVSGDVYSPEESKTIEENLRGLGYIE
jgi:predicted AlkP superfamily phosphohydrolase/phosphomutase